MNSNVIKTPFPRLIAGISVGSFGYNLALITNLAFLLTVKLAMLDPANLTQNFSILGLSTGIVGIPTIPVLRPRILKFWVRFAGSSIASFTVSRNAKLVIRARL